MASPQHDLGRAHTLTPSAIGPPGRRRFRLDLESSSGSAVLWLEKEQIFNLAVAAKRLLAIGGSAESPPPETPQEPSAGPHLEFQVSRLLLSQEAEAGLFVLGAYDAEDELGREPRVSVSASAEQLGELANKALEVCAAGRPSCPLCGSPMDPEGHSCSRTNGHFKGQLA